MRCRASVAARRISGRSHRTGSRHVLTRSHPRRASGTREGAGPGFSRWGPLSPALLGINAPGGAGAALSLGPCGVGVVLPRSRFGLVCGQQADSLIISWRFSRPLLLLSPSGCNARCNCVQCAARRQSIALFAQTSGATGRCASIRKSRRAIGTPAALGGFALGPVSHPHLKNQQRSVPC
jgi:hypothetical protein